MPSTPQRRALRSGEVCLRNGIELFAVVYPKVGKGRRSGIGFYAAAYQKVRKHKFDDATQRPRVLHYCEPESME